MDLPQRWRAYARLQQQLSRNTRLGHWAWGLEAGLNFLLNPDNDESESELRRAVATAERRHRNRRVVLRRYYAGVDEEEHAEQSRLPEAVDADNVLSTIRSRVAELDWFALVAVAEGCPYGDVALTLAVSAGTLRVRILRLRKHLLKFAA